MEISDGNGDEASTSVSSPEVKKVMLRSSDGDVFEVEVKVAMELEPIKNIIEDDCAHGVIPVPNVSSSALANVIKYCEKHVEADPGTEEYGASLEDLRSWDLDFVNKIKGNHDLLFDLIMGAHYLNVKGLFDLTCQTVADMMNGRTPDVIRLMFNIKNDYTQEEMEEVQRENAWAFE
ncbi:SKP1-like protein 1A [Elaeis guineensis]|uniref:SKP1-like protein n=1 Tax=Elaeis guineensis var. tenera TaxID=51953 RepID=A0A6I9SC93_ELAGV|nr:SKP1-like protein 1A [Elaeis guineensis]